MSDADASLDASLAAHIAAHLRLAATRRPENADALEVAAQCVCEAYGLEPSAPVPPAGRLLEIFAAAQAAGASADGELLRRFLENLTSRGFFAGLAEGSEAMAQRRRDAVAAFHAKFGAADAAPADAADAAPPSEPERLLAEGRALAAADDAEGAVRVLGEAIDLDADGELLASLLNARAAALLTLQRYDDALADCETVAAVEPSADAAAEAERLATQARAAIAAAADAGASSSSSEPQTLTLAPSGGGVRSLDGVDQNALGAFFNNPQVLQLAERVAESFVSHDPAAINDANAVMGSLFGGVDFGALFAGGGAAANGAAAGAAGGSSNAGSGGGGGGAPIEEVNQLLDDPSFMATMNELGTSLSGAGGGGGSSSGANGAGSSSGAGGSSSSAGGGGGGGGGGGSSSGSGKQRASD